MTAAEIGSVKVRAPEIDTSKMTIPEVRAPEICAGQIESFMFTISVAAAPATEHGNYSLNIKSGRAYVTTSPTVFRFSLGSAGREALPPGGKEFQSKAKILFPTTRS